jgi:pimeloyl-ACP methyl ester carboxylesterase
MRAMHFAAQRADASTIDERPMQLGPDGHLVGVLTAPAAPPTTTAPLVVFLNAGVIHRVGPHRLHVTLARQLALRGITSLRLDLSGIGDSRPVPGAMSFRESAVADTRSAMDKLSSDLHMERFVLFGLCSGADNALATAAVDERVTGLVILDPPAYATRRARARQIAGRLRQLGGAAEIVTWGADAIMRRVKVRLAAATSPARDVGDPEPDSGGREAPPVASYRAQLGALLDRGVGIFAIFSGALGNRYNHPDQLFELFPELRGRLDRAYFPAANHTFTELDAQAELVSAVTAWIDRPR